MESISRWQAKRRKGSGKFKEIKGVLRDDAAAATLSARLAGNESAGLDALSNTRLSRRAFVAAGGSLALAVYLPAGRGRAEEAFRPSVWIEVSPSGDILFTCDRTDMGQGSPAALARIVADELEAPWERVKLTRMPDNPAAWPRPMGTGGSASVRHSFAPLREAAASAREMLRSAAAGEWGVDPGECACVQGEVVHLQTGARLDYGALVEAAARLDPPTDPVLKDSSEFRLIGRSYLRPDIPRKVLGSEGYAIDVRLPGQRTAVIARSPWPGAVPMRPVYDAQAALGFAGVEDVFEIPGDEHRPPGVVVLARDFWAAQQARAALGVEWVAFGPDVPAASDPGADFRRRLVSGLDATAPPVRSEGDAGAVLDRSSARRHTAQYEVPFLSHATMEPMNCTADVRANRCELWAPTQVQSQSQQAAAKLTGLPPDAVRINTPPLGGGFGRRLEVDFVAEAVLASRHAARPVKVVWTREDDMRHGYFRPAAITRMDAALDDAGRLLAWRQRISAPSILRQMRGVEMNPDPSALDGAVNFPYHSPNIEVSHAAPRAPVNLGFWRSVAHSYTCFFVETFVDELAGQAGRDPYAFRLSLLPEASRMAAVLSRAAQESGWGTPLPPDSGRGIACSECFGSFVAQVAQVSLAQGRPRVDRIDCAVDCGLAVDPATLRAQISGGIVYGLTAAFHGKLSLGSNGFAERNFDSYRMLTMHETPDIRVHIVNSGEPLGGIGEPGVPPAAPAVGNAIFAAAGRRLRKLPFDVPALDASASKAAL